MITQQDAKIIVNNSIRLTSKEIEICDDCLNSLPRTPGDGQKVWCNVIEQYSPNYKCTCDFYDLHYDTKFKGEKKVGIISPEGKLYLCKYTEHFFLTQKIMDQKNIVMCGPDIFDTLKKLGYVYIRYDREGYWLDYDIKLTQEIKDVFLNEFGELKVAEDWAMEF